MVGTIGSSQSHKKIKGMFEALQWLNVEDMIKLKVLMFIYKICTDRVPMYLKD